MQEETAEQPKATGLACVGRIADPIWFLPVPVYRIMRRTRGKEGDSRSNKPQRSNLHDGKAWQICRCQRGYNITLGTERMVSRETYARNAPP